MLIETFKESLGVLLHKTSISKAVGMGEIDDNEHGNGIGDDVGGQW